jgi:hypothetical protein
MLAVSDVLGLGCFAADYVLTLKRLVLRPTALVPAAGGGGPRLLPHNLFSAAPRNLSLFDVRMILDTKTFADYLGFFRQQLRTARDAAGTGPSMHTVSPGCPDRTLCKCMRATAASVHSVCPNSGPWC